MTASSHNEGIDTALARTVHSNGMAAVILYQL